MNKPRLEKLIVALEGVGKESFTMLCVARFSEGDRCGTPACVLGHYAFRRDLQHTFKLRNRRVWFGHRSIFYDSPEVSAHFGVTLEQTQELFSSYGCGGAKTPAQARRYIRRFIDTNGEMK